ncbi:YeaH/YhbH family protein [Catalinimonas niigatensis]|uniref:YeaH/YhbH family protein n=1 Tax=Catalinimonas niigatensis TaxID=1397264 RepID=UPI002665ADD1|nr:YeaH/YhbH family protein [Catalinimonas niigatensis]WPP51281.1 YeaH/YhbH family protein [Catalinimonas niigatensis]
MSNIIDRRKNIKGKSTNNRQKFLKRVEDQIKEAIPDIISQESIKDSNGGGKVKVPIKGLKEPNFRHDPRSGKKQYIRPGNDKFSEGDKVPKPEEGGKGAGSGKGSNSPEISQDDFVVILSRDEFLKYFFEDLELPNMVKKYMESTTTFRYQRAGYTKDSIPSRLNIKTSFQHSLARQISLKGVYAQKIKKLEEELINEKDENKRLVLEQELEKLNRLKNTIPFFEDVDLRYNNFETVPKPATSAVMFCIMDVSASMGYHEKDIAKRFFTLLYIFLTKQYHNVDIVYIRHHTESKEVEEEEFFNSRESGGTVVAPSLRLMHKIMKERYDPQMWNVYCCQASDGDVWSNGDAVECSQFLKNEVLNEVQYMAYIEIKNRGLEGYLWHAYKKLRKQENFSMRNINDISQIWPVFKALFKKKSLVDNED